MLRLATWYESCLGRNDGNPLYVTTYLRKLEAEGKLKLDHLRPVGDTAVFGKYDLNLWIDWGEDGLTGLLPYEVKWPTGAPVLYWASDTHIHDASYQYRLSCARKADLVFVAQKRAQEQFAKDGVSAIWLPHAVEPRAYCDKSDPTGTKPYNFLTKDYDVAFVGHVNNERRVEALDRLFREFPNFFYGQRLFNDAANIYARSKIVFNIAMTDDINMRCFEALGSRSFLITDDLPTLRDLFTPDEHLVTYTDLDDMVRKVSYYLKHDEEREKIAAQGYAHVIKNHTIECRVNTMLSEAFARGLIKENPTLKKEGVLHA